MSRSVEGGAVASAVEEFSLTFEATLSQIQELSTVVSDAIDVQRAQRFHESGDITVGDKDRLFGEPVKANPQSPKCLKHAVKDGLVGVLKGIKDGFVAVLAGMNKVANGLLDGLALVTFLSHQLGGLVPTYTLMVGFVHPLGVRWFSLSEQVSTSSPDMFSSAHASTATCLPMSST